MGELKIKERDVIVPGEIIAEGMEFIPSYGTYRKDDKIIAMKLGLANISGKVIKLIPLSGRYAPKRGDVIIGNVTEILLQGWIIETNCAYHAMLPMKDATHEFIERGADLTQFYKVGDFVMTKIINVTSQKLIDVSMKGPGLKKLIGGQVLAMNHNKVPRVIGKSGSMIGLIKRATGCQVYVGQNGVIWIKGTPEKEVIAVEAIRLIENNSHVNGLTDTVKKMLTERVGPIPDAPPQSERPNDSGQRPNNNFRSRRDEPKPFKQSGNF
jgi:exosome complex component RRP4